MYESRKKIKNYLVKSLKLKPIAGYKYVIGSYRNKAVALTRGPNHYLTMRIHREILEEAKSLNLKKPVKIFASVNAGPNGSNSYIIETLEHFYIPNNKQGQNYGMD